MERNVRDYCGKSVAKGGPPAESECLEWKSLHILPFGGVSASRNVALFFIPIMFSYYIKQ
ncbi:hypothetical protein ACIP97_04670 [Peribacillus frigoritolerans]|uniref:hypothetical protein n=1 Tax=Peribacillus frigoritolerans TaxID=450367 RepID=UPI0037F18C7B